MPPLFGSVPIYRSISDLSPPVWPSAPIALIYSIFPSLPWFFHPLSRRACVSVWLPVFLCRVVHACVHMYDWLKWSSAICRVPVSLIPAEWIQLCASHTGVERRGWGDLGRVCVGVGVLDSNGMTERTETKIESDRGVTSGTQTDKRDWVTSGF